MKNTLKDNIKLVKDLINYIFSPRKEDGLVDEDGYKNILNYYPFYSFSFDWMNHLHFNNNEVVGGYRILSENNITIPCADEIKHTFTNITGLDESSYKCLFEDEINAGKDKKGKKQKLADVFGGSVDPDNMNIIKAIMGVLHRDEEDIRADTMISLHYAIGSPMYEGSNSEFLGPQNLYGKKDTRYEYISLYNIIKGFERVESTDIEWARQFFNLYHTLGNFVVSPTEINRKRSYILKDNYYAFINYLDGISSKPEVPKPETIVDGHVNFYEKYYKDGDFNSIFKKKKYCSDLFIPMEFEKRFNDIYSKSCEKNVKIDDQKEFVSLACNIIQVRCHKMIVELYKILNEEDSF